MKDLKRDAITILIIAVIGGFLIPNVLFPRATANPTPRKAAVVVIHARYAAYSIDTGPGLPGSGYGYRGYFVDNASSSTNAPQIQLPTFWTSGPPPNQPDPDPVSLAQITADLLDAEYEIRNISPDGMTLTFIKR